MKRQNAKEITAHGKRLLSTFPKTLGLQPAKLCRRLRRIELLARKGIEAYTNGEKHTLDGIIYDFGDDGQSLELFETEIMRRVGALLGPVRCAELGVYVSGDPRRPILRCESFGALCPEFGTDNSREWRHG